MRPGSGGTRALARAARRALALLAAAHLPAFAQTGGWEIGAVVDVGVVSRALELGLRDKGLGFGHSDLLVRGPVGGLFDAQASIAWHSHDGRVEAELHEAWMQTRGLPGGFQVRAGRFLSQIGYLNEKHPHADDFVERPLLYRAFLGNHWFDDGIRLNWTAPTPIFLRLGAELFDGRQLIPQTAESTKRPGIAVLSAKAGGDLGVSHSWQIGASWMYNRREAAGHDEEGHEEGGHEHGHDHDHAHGAEFSGRRMWLFDVAWKWAPGGDNRRQQVRVVFEHARVTEPNRYADPDDRHQSSSLSLVWRFSPHWETGVRTDRLRVRIPHGDHFHDGSLTEYAAMIAWKPSHRHALRLQYTTQRDAQGFEDAARRSVTLQYVVGLGAHGAHDF
jgi:hypothetical protein